jgi:hypothetical protein
MDEPERFLPPGRKPGSRRHEHSVNSIGPSVLKAQIQLLSRRRVLFRRGVPEL